MTGSLGSADTKRRVDSEEQLESYRWDNVDIGAPLLYVGSDGMVALCKSIRELVDSKEPLHYIEVGVGICWGGIWRFSHSEDLGRCRLDVSSRIRIEKLI